MKIKQCEYAEARIGPFSHFLDKYGLKKYHSPNEPAIFFGMYSKLCLNTLKKHKNLAIIIWRGSDIISEKKRLESVIEITKTKKKLIKHVAISSFIQKDLDKVGIKYKFIPIGATKTESLKVCPLGNEVYAYVPHTRHNFYGGPYLDRIKNKCKFKINVATSVHSFSKEELYKIYERSFIGLRLTQHDGIANQVVEMGIMGRRCVHNGGHPNCIQWKNDDDILAAIEEESKYIGSVKQDISDRMKEYIDVGSDWLNTEFWK